MKDVDGFEGRYAVSKEGRIWSYPKPGRNGHSGKWLNGSSDKDGYREVRLNSYAGAPAQHRKIHRVVANAYIPNPMNLPHVNHINGLKTDNRVENLEWTTHAENMSHARLNNLATKPENARHTKLNWKAVVAIRFSDESPKSLATKYNVSEATISRVLAHKIWK